MAKINEELLVIKISTLVRDNEDSPVTFDEEAVKALEEAITSMCGNGQVVEIIKDL